MTKTVRYAAVAAKLLLLALLLAALIWPDLSGIKGKASTARLIVYPCGALVLPLWWWIRGRKGAFPWAADLLITLPWLIDLLGNRLDLFDTVGWWDDAMHFVLWALLTSGVLLAFAPSGLSRALTVFVALGFGSTAAVVWEIGEYVAFVRSSPELQTAYTDTLGDLALGTVGALLAGLIVSHTHRAGAEPPLPFQLIAGGGTCRKARFGLQNGRSVGSAQLGERRLISAFCDGYLGIAR